MAVLYGTQMAKLRNSTPVQLPAVSDVHGRVRVFNENVTLASQTTSDTIEIASLPKGARVLYGVLTTDTGAHELNGAVRIAPDADRVCSHCEALAGLR